MDYKWTLYCAVSILWRACELACGWSPFSHSILIFSCITWLYCFICVPGQKLLCYDEIKEGLQFMNKAHNDSCRHTVPSLGCGLVSAGGGSMLKGIQFLLPLTFMWDLPVGFGARGQWRQSEENQATNWLKAHSVSAFHHILIGSFCFSSFQFCLMSNNYKGCSSQLGHNVKLFPVSNIHSYSTMMGTHLLKNI